MWFHFWYQRVLFRCYSHLGKGGVVVTVTWPHVSVILDKSSKQIIHALIDSERKELFWKFLLFLSKVLEDTKISEKLTYGGCSSVVRCSTNMHELLGSATHLQSIKSRKARLHYQLVRHAKVVDLLRKILFNWWMKHLQCDRHDTVSYDIVMLFASCLLLLAVHSFLSQDRDF